MLKTEYKRQAIHIGIAFFAFILKYLTRWQALALAVLAVLFNLFVIPKSRIKHHIYREDEHIKQHAIGFIAYPLSIAILLLIYPLDIVAIAWCVMGVGDGFSSIIGKTFGKKKLFWNRRKSYAGFFAFVASSFLAVLLVMLWNNMALHIVSVFFISIAVSLTGAVIESIPTNVDDNLSVPIITATLAYLLIRFI